MDLPIGLLRGKFHEYYNLFLYCSKLYNYSTLSKKERITDINCKIVYSLM